MVEAMEGGGARLSDLGGPKSHQGEFGLYSEALGKPRKRLSVCNMWGRSAFHFRKISLVTM